MAAMTKFHAAALLPAVLCLSLAACSQTASDESTAGSAASSAAVAASTKSTPTAAALASEAENIDLAGADWRTQGNVDDMGMITRDGTDTMVCICVNDDSVEFYYDEPEQIFYDMAFYPAPVVNARQNYNGAYFDDLNGDGDSDLCLFFLNDDGSDLLLTWYWNAEDGYVFDAEASNPIDISGSFDPGTAVQTDYFDEYGLEINASMDTGTYLLEDGVGSFIPSNEDYALGSAWWEVTKRSDYTHDGFREIEFAAICYIPDEAIPSYYEEEYYGSFTSVVSGELYDRYTGMWLTAASTHMDTGRSDNHYVHTIEWNGESYEIEYFYSTEWPEVGDWNQVLIMSYIVYLPEGYDGLVFAAQSMPGSYEECQDRLNLESICPEADLFNCDTVDARSNLYFAID